MLSTTQLLLSGLNSCTGVRVPYMFLSLSLELSVGLCRSLDALTAIYIEMK
jgi:hypothetical protein